MVFGMVQTFLNFYTYGKRNFTRTGYIAHKKKYEAPNFHENVDLSGQVFLVTGANSGLGKELTKYLAVKGAYVYMVCRSRERGVTARESISSETGSQNLHLLIADVGIDSDVRRVWTEFCQHRQQAGSLQLNGLVCNAGALLKDRTLNEDGFETTFSCHLACGTYLLGKLAIPTLEATPDSRLLIVSSGGMYNAAFPGWEAMMSTAPNSEKTYDGNVAYAWAKRGQVILAEEWAKLYPKVKVVSAHPGWTDTEGVTASLSDVKKSLEPLRSPWEGVEGMAWLLAAPAEELKSGEFYLDRQPQPKNISGLFWTEGGATRNTDDEIAMMMANLERFTNKEDPLWDVWRPTPERTKAKLESRTASRKLTASETPIEIERFMGKWNVLANIPITALGEQNYYNCVENYAWDAEHSRVQVVYNYCRAGDDKLEEARQHGYIQDTKTNTTWSLHPKFGIYLPLNLGYLVLHTAPDYSWTMIGVPDRKFLWVMTAARPSPKDPQPWPVSADRAAMDRVRAKGSGKSEEHLSPAQEAEVLREALLKAEACGYDISQLRICGWYPEVPYS